MFYEHSKHPVLSRGAFYRRIVRHAAVAILVLGCSLGFGVLGYHYWGQLEWLDALVNASMILGGMGPVDPVKTTSGKLFASFYALFSGIVFLGTASLLLAPFVHRFLHRFHLPEK